MARLFLTENKFQKLSKNNNPEVRVVLSEIINEEDKVSPEYNVWENMRYVNKLSLYNANIVIDGKVAFTINASLLHRLTRNIEQQMNTAFEQVN